MDSILLPVTVAQYLETKKRIAKNAPQLRTNCLTCRQPDFRCYCTHIQKFDSKIKFVILIHGIEARRRIATGRMSHLILENSDLILGQDYTQNCHVNQIIEDPRHHPVILYPGLGSANLSSISPGAREDIFPQNKKLVIFVIDGTWNTARKTMYKSQNLKKLPTICFTPPRPSQFRVRKQPAENCFSTIEAIHYTIELIGSTQGFETSTRTHDNLLTVFNHMVEGQLDRKRTADAHSETSSYRRVLRGRL